MNPERTNIIKGALVMPVRNKNAQWLWDHRNYESDDCLIWPFSRNEGGYGQLGFEGTMWKAHKLMCSFVHGERRYPEYEVRHSCGRGKDGCVNPRHLSWSNKSENGRDKKKHGTTGKGRRRYKLTRDEVIEIRALKGKEIVRTIAERYGVSQANIRMIWAGGTWSSLPSAEGNKA
jgi:hypothetical protein